MDETERITYTTTAFEIDFANIGTINSHSQEEWERTVLTDTEIDPIEVHAKYGVLPPQIDKHGLWSVEICPKLINAPLAEAPQSELLMWVLYWISHLQLHVIVSDWQSVAPDKTTIEEVEFMVQEQFEAIDPENFRFGENIKALMRR